jgi:hypothetical protein
VQRAGATGPKLLRADSGFWNTKVFELLEQAGWQYSIGVRMINSVRQAVEAIPEDAWTKIDDYPDDGVAQIAETTFGGRRLIIRRTRLIGPQAELWPDWRHFCFVTNQLPHGSRGHSRKPGRRAVHRPRGASDRRSRYGVARALQPTAPAVERTRASPAAPGGLSLRTSTRCAGLPHLGRPLGQGKAGVCARSMGALGGRPCQASASPRYGLSLASKGSTGDAVWSLF